MDAIVTILEIASTLSPIAVIALLAVIIFLLVKARATNLFDVPDKVDAISDNHLSGLPDMAESLKRIESQLQNMNDNIIYIRARVNGK